MYRSSIEVVQVVDRYHYLGLVLTQFMDIYITVRYEAQAAQRALECWSPKVNLKEVCHSFRIFTKLLYDYLVQPILDYKAAIWGHKSFSCI